MTRNVYPVVCAAVIFTSCVRTRPEGRPWKHYEEEFVAKAKVVRADLGIAFESFSQSPETAKYFLDEAEIHSAESLAIVHYARALIGIYQRNIPSALVDIEKAESFWNGNAEFALVKAACLKSIGREGESETIVRELRQLAMKKEHLFARCLVRTWDTEEIPSDENALLLPNQKAAIDNVEDVIRRCREIRPPLRP